MSAPGLSPSPEPRLLGEARRLLASADAAGIPLRLLGGMGIRLLLGERIDRRFHRPIEDLDFITTRKASHALEGLLEQEGWKPERRFNALNGARRLLFGSAELEAKVDVFVETFQMCHALPLAERMQVRSETLPAAELAMTKLQIVALNTKDSEDLYALLAALEVRRSDFEQERSRFDAINAARIAQLAAGDWGLHHTFELNLSHLREGIVDANLAEDLAVPVARRIDALSEALEREPKSRAWRMRAKIGERKRWYEEPEEVERV
jgi:hypothetical protein